MMDSQKQLLQKVCFLRLAVQAANLFRTFAGSFTVKGQGFRRASDTTMYFSPLFQIS